MQSTSEEPPQKSPTEKMNDLYQWLTTWDRYVSKEKRPNESSENSDQKSRKRVSLN